MKTSTLILIAGGAAALYYLSKKTDAAAAQATQGVQSPPFAAPNAVMQIATPNGIMPMVAAPQVVVVAPDDDTGGAATVNYGPWGWGSPVFGARAWRSGGGRGGGHR